CPAVRPRGRAAAATLARRRARGPRRGADRTGQGWRRGRGSSPDGTGGCDTGRGGGVGEVDDEGTCTDTTSSRSRRCTLGGQDGQDLVVEQPVGGQGAAPVGGRDPVEVGEPAAGRLDDDLDGREVPEVDLRL